MRLVVELAVALRLLPHDSFSISTSNGRIMIRVIRGKFKPERNGQLSLPTMTGRPAKHPAAPKIRKKLNR